MCRVLSVLCLAIPFLSLVCSVSASYHNTVAHCMYMYMYIPVMQYALTCMSKYMFLSFYPSVHVPVSITNNNACVHIPCVICPIPWLPTLHSRNVLGKHSRWGQSCQPFLLLYNTCTFKILAAKHGTVCAYIQSTVHAYI